MLPEQQQRIMGYFIEEAKDHLNTIEQGLLNLQATLQDQEMLNEVFRAAHSVKGGAAMLGIGSIQKTAHRLEDYFKVLKEEERPIQIDQKLESLLLQVFDALQELLEQLQGPFGLTEDVANGVMSGVEPVFEQLHNHLEHLVHQGGGAPAQPAVASVPQPAPTPAVDPVLVVFQGDVAARLRDLLQAFKSAESAQSRQQLQDICSELRQMGEPFNLASWCELLEIARQAIACSDNSYRTLAPIVIKEVKQAQDLILAQRTSEVICSDRLRELVPVVVVPVTGVTGEADLGDLFDIPAVADNLAVDDLFAPVVELPTATPEVRQPQVPEPVASSGLADYGFGDDLAEALDFEQPGPEVGMAELNSLADLFEGEVLDLGATWQEEEIVSPTLDSGPLDLGGSPDLDELTDTSDFSDLLNDFEEDGAAAPTAAGLPKDDLASLFGDDDLLGGDQDAASPPSNFGSAASVTDEIDALFGDGFSDLEAEDTAPVVEANQSSLENLGELFADLEETELAAPTVVVQAPLEEDLETGNGDSDFLALDGDSSLEGFDFDVLSEDDSSPDLFEAATTLEDSNGLGDLDLDLFGDDELPGDEIAAVDNALDSDDLDLFGDDELPGDEIAAVDDVLGSDDVLGDLFDAQSELVVAVPEPLEIDDPWQESSQPQGNAGNSLDDMFAAALPTDHSLDLADDLFGESASESEASQEADPEVLDDSNALDFDLATLSVESADSSEELLPDFNFDMDASLAAADNLSDSSEGMDFLLDAADLAEIQPSVASDARGSGVAVDEDAFGDLWGDNGADLPMVENTSDLEVAPAASEDLATDWLEPENLVTDADTNDFSGSLDSLFDETSEDFGSLDLESDAQVDGLSEFDAIALDTPSAGMSADTDDLFGLSLDAGLDELDGSADLSLDGLGDSSDLGLDLFEVTDDGLAAIPADDPSLSGTDLLPDLDLLGSDGSMGGATAESEELDLLGLAELEVPINADLMDGAATDGAFDELDDLLAEMPATEPAQDAQPAIALESAGAEDEFADLDALLGDAPAVSASNVNEMAPAPAEDDFADLEALLGDAPTPAAPPVPVPVATPPAPAPKVAADSEFDDLEKLLEDADKTMGGAPTVKGRGASAQPRRPKNPNVIDQTMRVPVKQLDNLSNLVGELVVNRNSLEQDQERLRQFLDNLLYQVQQLSDVGQRMRDLYERSLLESSLLASRQSYQSSSTNATAQSHSTGASFDALEMDRFTGFHSLSQEMIELIVRVRESASDIEFIIDETDQVTRNFRQVTTQLQEGLTRSRMVPFAQTADRLPRGVRDNAIKCGKQAELVVEGRETLIDKMILEQLYDPLNHLVNNAIAHGIETPEVRQAAGKPPSGRVTIRAFYQGNQTVISVSDDGAGIDPERIKAKAIEKKVITPAEAKTMNRLDVYDILFAPGFSGADQVTDLAGRGVGMDVVRTRLNEIRGTINIDSTIGKGTTFTIRLPLTLSISKALCCISNRARIAFPMDGVEDMLDVPKERIQTNAEGQSCILWRDLLLPFQSLSDVLKYSRYLGRGSVYGGNQEDDIVSIVVLRSAGNFIALQVDQVLGEQEIVIKQLEGPVPKPVGVAGATVLGDGRIMPIADVLELIDLVQGRIPHQTGTKLWEQSHEQTPVEPPVAKTEPTVLIVDDSITVRELLSMTFNKVGYRVEQARDGQEAWEKLRSGLPCDMVFCDIEMPRMDGLELLSRIQKDTTLNHLPIAMLTSRGADRHRQMAVQLGARGYFTKPYLEEALLDAAQRMLKGEILVTSGSPG